MDEELQGPISSLNEEPDKEVVLDTANAVVDSQGQVFDNTFDLDLVNVLYVNRIPQVPDAQRAALQTVVDDLKLWEQWEIGRVESTLQDRVKRGDLPKDNTVEAKSKRTGYRIKVQQYLRDQTPWFGIRKDVSHRTQKQASSKAINLEVLYMLLATSPLPQDIQFTTILKAIGLGFDAANSMVRPFALTIVDYGYDSISASFRPQITSLSFDVDIQPVPKTEKTPSSIASLTYNTREAIFDIGLWDTSKPDPGQVQLGASILPQRQLTLLRTDD